MKLISLNTWGGRAGRKNFLDFFALHKDIDVFCLQEMWLTNHKHLSGKKAGGQIIDHSTIVIIDEIEKVMSGHTGYFRPHLFDTYGLMMFAKKDFPVIEEGEVFVYKEKGYRSEGDLGNHARNIQYIKTNINGKAITILNFHGLWNGKGKTDTEDRVQQSKNIIEFMRKISGECILIGDFNLLPETESLRMFETFGLRNLIREYGITSTRTSFYKKPERYADYAFVTKGIKVKKFEVLPDEVSDHAALYLEVE